MPRPYPLLAFALAVSAPVAAAELVPTPGFRSVELRGGGSLVVRPGPVQRVTLVSGSRQHTQLQVDRNGKLTIDVCRSPCPPRYRLHVVVESPTVPDVAVMGGGKISAATGFRSQPRLATAVSGGGEIDARSVAAGTVAAAVNGGGRILVHPRDRLQAAVNGGGQVRYLGNPRVMSAINGGGTVTSGS